MRWIIGVKITSNFKVVCTRNVSLNYKRKRNVAAHFGPTVVDQSRTYVYHALGS